MASDYSRASVEIVTPFQHPDVAPMVRRTGTVIHAAEFGEAAEFMLHAYVAKVSNVAAAPRYPGVLAPDHGLVVQPDPIDQSQDPAANSFGSIVGAASGKRVTVAHRPSGQTIKTPVVKTTASGGYGIFILDCLVSLHHALSELGEGVPVLVPDDLDARRRFLLSLTGVRADQLVEAPNDRSTRLRDCFLVSRVFARDPILELGGRKRNLRFLVDPVYTTSFNRLVARRFHQGLRRRIYISRADASGRKINNERALIESLARLGFEAHQLVNLKMEQTVEMFANAEIIVTPHGSGASNAMFAPLDTTVIEIDHPRNDFAAFGIARSLGQRYRVFNRLREKQRDRSDRSDQTVDIDALCVLIREELERRG